MTLPNCPFSLQPPLYADDILLSQNNSSPTSMFTIQSNINLISSWITFRHLTINSKKTKNMIISHKSPSFLTFSNETYIQA